MEKSHESVKFYYFYRPFHIYFPQWESTDQLMVSHLANPYHRVAGIWTPMLHYLYIEYCNSKPNKCTVVENFSLTNIENDYSFSNILNITRPNIVQYTSYWSII